MGVVDPVEEFVDRLVEGGSPYHGDPTFNSTVPRLDTLCVRTIARNFSEYPTLEGIPASFVPRVCALLPVDLPISTVCASVDDSDYWRRRFLREFPSSQKRAHLTPQGSTYNTPRITKNSSGVSPKGNAGRAEWKRRFLEEHVARALEGYGSGEEALRGLTEVMALAQGHVRTLRLAQLPSHIDMEELFFAIPNLEELFLTYGVREMGLEYNTSLYGMHRSDARCLSNALPRTKTLTTLHLTDNKIDDTLCRVLCSGLVGNTSVTELNLSHNAISDTGARAVSQVLSTAGNGFVSLLLTDNSIGEEGAFAIGKALRRNHTLETLDLRLNRVGDSGGARFFDNLVTNNTLLRLNVGSCRLENESASAVANFLRANTSLEEMDCACNRFGQDGGVAILAALKDNTSLVSMDIRRCDIDDATAAAIRETRREIQDHRRITRVRESGGVADAAAKAPAPLSALAPRRFA